MSDQFRQWAVSKGIFLGPATACHRQAEGQTDLLPKEAVIRVPACEVDGNQSVNTLRDKQLKVNCGYNSSRGNYLFHSLYEFTVRFGQANMPYSLNKGAAETDRHVHVTNTQKPAKERKSLQANKRHQQKR